MFSPRIDLAMFHKVNFAFVVTPLGLYNGDIWSSINLNLWRKEMKVRRDISDGESHSKASDDGRGGGSMSG